MAIQFARVDIISRKAGGSAVGIASYVSRSQRQAEGTRREYYFSHKKDDLVFHTVMTPENAPAWAQDGAMLWNAAEACDKKTVREWEETLKLQRSVERSMSRGFSMGL